MQTPPSPLETLRQLKEMLDAGALTPAEFDALKQRLVFADTPPAPLTGAPEPPLPLPAPPAVSIEPPLDTKFNTGYNAEPPVPVPVPVSTPWTDPEPEFEQEPEPEPEATWTASEFDEPAAPPSPNPLALILSIGGLMALLGLVLYLSLNRHPSEHISSTSQTAADSVHTAIETGPQASLPPATVAPETVRVAPAHPAIPIAPRPAPAVRDSATAPVSPPVAPADSAAKP